MIIGAFKPLIWKWLFFYLLSGNGNIPRSLLFSAAKVRCYFKSQPLMLLAGKGRKWTYRNSGASSKFSLNIVGIVIVLGWCITAQFNFSEHLLSPKHCFNFSGSFAISSSAWATDSLWAFGRLFCTNKSHFLICNMRGLREMFSQLL